VRILLSVAAVLGIAACTPATWMTPPPGQLVLSNFRFEHAAIEAVVTASPDCSPSAGGPVDFDLPFKGTRVVEAAPAADICWRRQTGAGQWTDWNRAYTASGRSIDSQL
jgi:hypothetical protein